MHRIQVALRTLSLVLVLAPSASMGQVVVGTVRDGTTAQPVLGAMVRLMADSVWTGSLFLTAADGRFSLEAPRPGLYDLRVERIGFATTTAGPVVLSAGETVSLDLDVAATAVQLGGLEVTAGRRRCSLEDDALGETQLLWAEARKALDAARWTEREAGLEFQVSRRSTRLDPTGRHVRSQDRRTMSARGGNSVRTLPPAELVEGGYVQEKDGFMYYYGPDADVLLSDEFLATHCFAVVEGREGEPGMVGLEFTPVRGRDLTDIEGVLWVDRASARLDRVEFSYTGLNRRPGIDQPRGALRFVQLSDGRWIVRDWSIMVPVLGISRQFVRGSLVEQVSVTAMQEEGSEVLLARGDDVEWRADPSRAGALALHCSAPGVVVGRVTDASGMGVAGAVVTAEGSVGPGGVPLSAVTEADGGYWICVGEIETALLLVARQGDLRSPPTQADVPRDGYSEVNLVVSPSGSGLPSPGGR